MSSHGYQAFAHLETKQKALVAFNPPLELVLISRHLTDHREDYYWATVDVASVDGEAVDASANDIYLTGAKRAYRTRATRDQDKRLEFTFNFVSLPAGETSPKFTYAALNHDIVLRFTFWASRSLYGAMTPNVRIHSTYSPLIKVRQ